MTYNLLYKRYLSDAELLKKNISVSERTIAWKSPSNIALIKYWGKHGNQLPDNPSLSFTLSQSATHTEVTYKQANENWNKIEFYLDDVRNFGFEKKLSAYFNRLHGFLPFLNNLHITIRSHNTFPHSAGIASSASSISALALCLSTIENQLYGTLTDNNEFLQKTSFMSRIGSGSACRSLYGPCVLWGFTPQIKDSSDETAIPVSSWLHPVFKTFHDAILIVDSSPKEVSSSAGHKLMPEHYYRYGRNTQVIDNLEKLTAALRMGDLELFTKVVESEALSLHGLMLSSDPGYILMKPNTLKIIESIKTFRTRTGIPCTFTLDAGPNIHLLYAHANRTEIVDFIERELKPLCEDGVWIDDTLSEGPVCIKK
jgi:diphosphomevalonate decarboxylase